MTTARISNNVYSGYHPCRRNNTFLYIWNILNSLGHGILAQPVKCRHTDNILTCSSWMKSGHQDTFNLKLKSLSVLSLYWIFQQSKEKQTFMMPSPQKEQTISQPQTNAQDSCEKNTKVEYCAITLDETSLPMRYIGLENQGATCYLNTVLQILFMTEGFRVAVERYMMNNSSCTINNRIAELFEHLKSGKGITATTEGITAELKCNVHKQEDAAKCLQKILNMVDPELTQIFQGMMVQTTFCINPAKDHKPLKQKKTFFIISISLDSEPHVHMQNCFDSYFAPIIMCGEGQQVYCKDCKKMMDTKIICSLKRVPSVLVLHLERFEFDYDAMCCIKNHSKVEIPVQLSVKEEAGEKHMYNLYAIANHVGSLSGGHYYADIKVDDKQWYQFDDSRVQKMDDLEHLLSDEAYLLLYKKCESENLQNNTTHICKDHEDSHTLTQQNTAGPDISFSRGTAQSPFSADSCLETQQKFIKRKNTCPKDNEPKRRRLSDSESLSMNQQTEQISIDNENEPIVRDEQDLQDHLNNTDSNAKLAKNLTEESSLNIKRQSTEDDNDSQSKLNISSGEMDCEPSVSKLNIESDTAKEDLQHLSNTVSEGSALLSALASTDESSPDIQSNDGDIYFQSKPVTADGVSEENEGDNDSQSKLDISSGEMDCKPSVSKLNIESDTAKEDLQHLSNTVSEGSALLSALASTDESSPDIQSNDGDIYFQSKPVTADGVSKENEGDNDSQYKLDISSGEMDCEPSVSKLNIESDTAKEDLQHLSNTVSEGSALLSALASTDESSPDIQSNDGDIDFQSKPITADEENGSHVSLDFEHLNKDNYTRRKQCNKIHFAWIFALLIVVFLCIINSGYCPPYLQLLIIILIFISLISLIFVVVTYLFHTMFTADRNGSNQSSVI